MASDLPRFDSSLHVPTVLARGPLAVAAAAVVFAVGASLAAPAATLAQQEPVELRLRAEEGATATYRFEWKSHLAPPPAMDMSATDVTGSAVVARTAEEVRGDTLKFRSRIEDIQLDIQSGNPQVQSQSEAAAKRSERMVGREFVLTVTRTGHVVAMEAPNAEAVSGGQIERSLRELSFVTLPERPVAPGDSWKGQETVDAVSFGIPLQGDVVTRTTTTLDRVFEESGSRIAELQVEATFEFRPTGETKEQTMQVQMNGSSAQTIRFDVDEGRFLSSSGAQDFTVNLSIPGQPVSFTVQGSNETSARLVEG